MTKQSIQQSTHCCNTQPELLKPPETDKNIRKTTPQHNGTSATNRVKDTDENVTLLKKDKFWQNSEPESKTPDENMESILSSFIANDQLFITDEFLNDFDIFAPVNNNNKQDITTTTITTTTTSRLGQYDDKAGSDSGYSTDSTDSKRRTALDSVSSTSDDSLASLDSVNECYRMTNNTPSQSQQTFTQQQQQQHNTTKNKVGASCTPSKTRRKIEPIYNNDPYLQRHRLMVNARQKNRMMKLNKMYTTLNSLIPENVAHEPSIKPHSKLGILKRAIVYWHSLSTNLLLHPAPPDSKNEEDDNNKHLMNGMFHTQQYFDTNHVPGGLNSGNVCQNYKNTDMK